jgi:hypothetical protein
MLIDQTEREKTPPTAKDGTTVPAEEAYNISSTANDMHIHRILLVSLELQETDIIQLQIVV